MVQYCTQLCLIFLFYQIDQILENIFYVNLFEYFIINKYKMVNFLMYSLVFI